MRGIKEKQEGLVFWFHRELLSPKATMPLAQPESDLITGFQLNVSFREADKK